MCYLAARVGPLKIAPKGVPHGVYTNHHMATQHSGQRNERRKKIRGKVEKRKIKKRSNPSCVERKTFGMKTLGNTRM